MDPGDHSTEARQSDDTPRVASQPFRIVAKTTHAPLPVVIAAPHGGRAYPSALLEAMRHPDEARLRLEDRHVDALALAVGEETGATTLIADAPRAMIDLNRAEDDVDWSMIAGTGGRGGGHSLANRRARMGLGLVPRRLPGLGEIWRGPLRCSDLEARIETIHRPYHRTLARIMQEVCDAWGAVVLIDLHSMPPLRKGPGQARAPDFVIGDRFGCSCASRLSARALQHFAGTNRLAAHNRPYSGGYVLDRHGQPARNLHAMQIEVCRSLYLDARFEEPSARFAAVCRVLSGLVRALAKEAMHLPGVSQSGFPQAAE